MALVSDIESVTIIM